MGKWTLDNISVRSDALDGAGAFGTNFRVELQLTYSPNLLTPFKESPVLDWQEKFTTLWYHAGNYWTFENNMFRLKPNSPSFQAWSKRYIAAYAFVTGQPSPLSKETVQFFDKKNKPLPSNQFAGKPAGTDGEKAAVIREYLGKNGGVFVIEIQDVPSIETNLPNKHVERLLLFDCGLEGDTKRVKAMQYLNVDTSQPSNTWQQEFQTTAPFTRNDQPAHGLHLVDPSANVSTPNTILFSGEFL